MRKLQCVHNCLTSFIKMNEKKNHLKKNELELYVLTWINLRGNDTEQKKKKLQKISYNIPFT